MKTYHQIKQASLCLVSLFLVSCTLFSIPTEREKSTMGEITRYTPEIRNLPAPKDRIVVGVYKFRDQTGQYKAAENGASWSTAVPQGTTTILLKALEDSRWFKPIERENIGNLLNERQIIRSTRKEYSGKEDDGPSLPPLLFAGIILEGGVVSYDTNVMTGGVGARYFGLGASAQYRQDRITVYLRAVSTSTGEIVKTVYTSKTILSTSVNGNFFRFIDTERLLESDIGFTQNEPVHLAVTEAIEKAVMSLIVEGVQDKLWDNKLKDPNDFNAVIAAYNSEKKVNAERFAEGSAHAIQRPRNAIFGYGEAYQLKGDYTGSRTTFGGKIGYKRFLTDHLNAELNGGVVTMENTGILKRSGITSEFNLEYLMMPRYKFSPFIYAGAGMMMLPDDVRYKAQLGGGLEYLMSRSLAVRLMTQYDLGFTDDWDGIAQGSRNDHGVRVGVGLNLYFGNKKIKK